MVTPGKVALLNPHGSDNPTAYTDSLINLFMYDMGHEQRLVNGGGRIGGYVSTGRLEEGRNDQVEQFLASPAEWAFMVDDDMAFREDSLERLLEVADPVARPVVGGLCFVNWITGRDDLHCPTFEIVPTIYRFDQERQTFQVIRHYQPDSVMRVNATGGAFLLVHRSVFEKVAAEMGPVWFDRLKLAGEKGRVGEDISFCLRAEKVGCPIHVHTGIKTGHMKQVAITENLFLAQQPGNVAVIPMKDNHLLTMSLVNQLVGQGECDAIVIFDNGSETPEAQAWLDSDLPDVVEVHDAAGWNIHQMWNRGLEMASNRFPKSNVAILNNDIVIGPHFMSGLADVLRSSDQIAAVCPNYDGRPGNGIQSVRDICANRYDGTGGFAGFAFMLRGESAYRFPEELVWWYGDNHLVVAAMASGVETVIALNTTVEHVGGGSQTADWAALEKITREDRDVFQQLCRELGFELSAA